MRKFGVCGLAGAGLLAMSMMAQAPTADEPAAHKPTFQLVGNMRDLMIDIIYPTSDALFYVDRNPPKNDHDWDLLRGQALMLAESGNLLMMPGRARDQENWIKYSRTMIELGQTAFRAAQAKNLAGITALNDPLSQVCIDCHYQYRPGYHRPRPPAAQTK